MGRRHSLDRPIPSSKVIDEAFGTWSYLTRAEAPLAIRPPGSHAPNPAAALFLESVFEPVDHPFRTISPRLNRKSAFTLLPSTVIDQLAQGEVLDPIFSDVVMPG
jgi:hypothetical protein